MKRLQLLRQSAHRRRLTMLALGMVMTVAVLQGGTSLADPPGEFDIAQKLSQASRAIADSLPEKAADLYREILEREPENDEAYRALNELASSVPLPRDSEPRALAREALDRRFVEYESKRFVVLSDADPTLTQARLNLLERTHHQVLRFSSRLELRPLPLQHKQVCILFARHDDYAEFALAHDGLSNRNISGYYSPRNDWVVFDDAASLPGVTGAEAQLQPLRAKVEELARQVRQASTSHAAALRSNLAHAQQVLDEQTRRVEGLAQRESTATTAHECTHQLLFHTRIQSPCVHSPLWICEGLATNFETDSATGSFGPDQEYQPRRDRFNTLLNAGKLLPVAELVQIDALPSDDADRTDVIYQQSYALVKWMCRFRKAQLREYLMTMLTQPPQDVEPAGHLAIFQKCFGNADSVEKAWLKFERGQLQASAE